MLAASATAVGFESSSAALQAFRAEPQRFDLILTDEAMPDLVGTEALRTKSGGFSPPCRSF